MKHLDKLHHVVYTFSLAVAGAFVSGPVLGLLAAALAGVAKELYDQWSPAHRFDPWDLAADAAGIVAAWVVIG